MNNLNEWQLRKVMEEGRKITEIVEDPLFVSCLEAVNKEFHRAFLGDDEEAARLARHDRRGLERFLGKLKSVQDRGQKAAKKLEEIKEIRQEGGEPADLLNKGIV